MHSAIIGHDRFDRILTLAKRHATLLTGHAQTRETILYVCALLKSITRQIPTHEKNTYPNLLSLAPGTGMEIALLIVLGVLRLLRASFLPPRASI